MERCARCRIREDEVKLFNAIYEGKMDFLCERCAIIENIPIIRKPDTSQLKESERGIGVYERLRKINGIKLGKKPSSFFREDRLKELEKNPEKELPEKEKLNLIEHFHWEVMKARRRKGLSQKQLANAISESEIAIQMIEKAKLPENSESLIRKLEQFLRIPLRKITETDRILERNIERKEPILLDEFGNELEKIPEPEIEYKVEIKEDIFEKGYDKEKEVFDIHKADLSNTKISDLLAMRRRKIQVTKQEKIEEQKKIEERKKLIEARKEELRLLKEKESEELDKILGGKEILKKKKQEDIIEEFEDELV